MDKEELKQDQEMWTFLKWLGLCLVITFASFTFINIINYDLQHLFPSLGLFAVGIMMAIVGHFGQESVFHMEQ